MIEEELGSRYIPERVKPIVKRVIHATADFDYADNLRFSENAVEKGLSALSAGSLIVTDTNMALAGINKPALKYLGCEAVCFMADKDVAEQAKNKGATRAAVSVDKAAQLGRPIIFACGNAPTALIRLCELMNEGFFCPELIIAVPVGFVNVVQSKEMIAASGAEYIAAMGRKGGSSVAAAICNALMYMITRK